MGVWASASRKQLYFVGLAVFGLIIFLIFSWNGTKHEQELIWKHSEDLELYKNALGTKLFDLKFKYVLTANSCVEDDLLAMIIVTSHYNNVETRSAMRRSFTQEELTKMRIRRVFLLGEAPDSLYMTQAAILRESKRFGDIIQGNFFEAYRNLTYKHIMGLMWVSENCQSVKYVIKMDDDIVFNINKLSYLLSKIKLPRNSIAGYILRGMKPIREPANKWYVTQEEYQFSKYPTFVSGWFYVTTPKIASKLALTSHYFKYFWIDDVFVTGLLAKNLKIRQYDLHKYFTVHSEFLQCCIAGVKKHLECDILVGPNGGNNNLFYEFNEAMKTCEFEHCYKRVKSINETCVAEKRINLKGGSGIIENYKLH